MRKITWLMTMVLTMALGVGQIVAAADPYTDPDGHFSFTPPDGYQQLSMRQVGQALQAGGNALGVSRLPNNLVVSYQAPASTANVNVGASPLPNPDLTLDDVTNALRDTYQSLNAVMIDVQDAQETTLGGEPARSFDYTLTVNGIDLHGRQTVAIHNGSVYIVTFTALAASADQRFTEMQPVIDTFMFLD